MISAIKKYLSRRDGSTAVEFGIVSILFIMFLVGIFEAGRAFWILNRLQFATENATRYALTDTDVTNATLEDRIDDDLEAVNIDLDDITVTITNPSNDGITFKEVVAVYDFSPLSNFLPGGWGSFDLTATSRIPLTGGE